MYSLALSGLFSAKWTDQIQQEWTGVVAAAKKAWTSSLQNPPNTAEQCLETLTNQGLIVSSARLKEFQALICLRQWIATAATYPKKSMKTLKKALALLTPHERQRGLLVLVLVMGMALLETAGVASVMPFLAVWATPRC